MRSTRCSSQYPTEKRHGLISMIPGEMNQIGKMLETRYKDDEAVITLGKTFTHITKIVDELQLDITAAQMLPVGTVFTHFPRMVRDLAQKAGKKMVIRKWRVDRLCHWRRRS